MKARCTLLLAALALPLASAAHAVPLIPGVTTSAGTTFNANALTGFQTNPADMNGSVVTVTFAGGGTASAVWNNTGASASGWSLTEFSDTFSGTWTFSNTGSTAITGFSFNGVPGNTIFDIVSSPDNSPGSAAGRQFSNVDGPGGLAVDALYTNRLTVGGVFYGDEYTMLVVTFGGAGLAGDSSLTFLADTDNASAASGGIGAVPEPSTWAMLFLGFAGVGFMAYRRARKDRGLALAA